MAFMLWLHQIKSKMENNDRLFFVDGTHPQHNSMASYGWIKKGEIKELKTTAARYRLNLLGALDTNNLNCFVRNYETLNAANTIFFFKDLEKRNVTAEKLYLVVDGGRYFHSKEVLYNEYYEKFPDFVQASLDFFKNFKSYKSELETLLTEKIEFVGV